MQVPNLKVVRYDRTTAGYAATVEPEDKSWILYIPPNAKDKFAFIKERDPETGAALSDPVPL